MNENSPERKDALEYEYLEGDIGVSDVVREENVAVPNRGDLPERVPDKGSVPERLVMFYSSRGNDEERIQQVKVALDTNRKPERASHTLIKFNFLVPTRRITRPRPRLTARSTPTQAITRDKPFKYMYWYNIVRAE